MSEAYSEPVTIDFILDIVRKTQPDANFDIIRKAYELAAEAHKGQKRASGEDYIIHPLNVAAIIADLHMDESTISAALLHDVVEDTTFTIEQMQEMFSPEIAMLIDGVTKLGKIEYKSKEEQQLENYRKMFLAMAKDIRVILIKLADRLHNMRTLKYMREDKQQRIAQETIEIYAPLANRMGISNIKCELEDLCLRYLHSDVYYDLVESVKQKRTERMEFIESAIEQMRKQFVEDGIKCEIHGRAKHFYSIYKKMRRDNKSINEIYDLSAVRVLVHSVRDCYAVLGTIHEMWKPIPGRFKDYISMPKTNGYQSLHTTVMTKGYPLEIQIRTFKMHQVSEYGVAAHWKYKEAGASVGADGELDQKMSWLRQMVNLQQELSDPKEYVEALKVDVFSDEVFVFTPKGEIINLPKGSIPLDFAYRIHTEVGHHCVGAKVNGKLVPLEYKLKNGDIVSIITNKANGGPSRDWLNIVGSPDSRNKIRSWFKKAKREENIERAKEMLHGELKHLSYDPKNLLQKDKMQQIADRFHLAAEDDLLAAIGYGGVSMKTVVTKLVEMHKKEVQEAASADMSKILEELKPHNGASKRAGHGVLVQGERGLMVRLAHCCNPIPGDPIVGFITRGRGVSVHRSDCPNISSGLSDIERVMEVSWDIGIDKFYTVKLEITCNDRQGMLTQLLAIPSEMKLNISSINAKVNRKNRTSIVEMGLEVNSSSQVTQVINKLRQLKDVYNASRKMTSSGGKGDDGNED